MRAIAAALRSIAKLTGLRFLNDLAKPIQEFVNTKDKIKMQVSSTKSRIGTTVKDVKNAVNQDKAS